MLLLDGLRLQAADFGAAGPGAFFAPRVGGPLSVEAARAD
jgi:hypothetical protein